MTGIIVSFREPPKDGESGRRSPKMVDSVKNEEDAREGSEEAFPPMLKTGKDRDVRVKGCDTPRKELSRQGPEMEKRESRCEAGDCRARGSGSVKGIEDRWRHRLGVPTCETCGVHGHVVLVQAKAKKQGLGCFGKGQQTQWIKKCSACDKVISTPSVKI